MKRLFALLAAAFLLLSPPSAGLTSAASLTGQGSSVRVSNEAGDVSLKLIHWRSYWYQDQILWVIGEVQNTGLVPVANPLVTGHFSDSSGKLVAEAAGYADSLLINPGAISTFRITL